MAPILKFRTLCLIQSLLFFIPVNIYIIGNNLAAGIQWIFFRYQQSYFGNCIIIFYKDLFYIQAGLLKGRSAVAAGFEVIATVVIVLAFFLLLVAVRCKQGTLMKAAAICYTSGGCLFFLSDVTQYGIFLHGPTGFVIPIGVPVFFITGWWIYHRDFLDPSLDSLLESQTENETPEIPSPNH